MTLAMSKHLLSVYDKPMIYYPMSTLMMARIRDVLLISTTRDLPLYRNLFGDGSQLGISISYAVQDHARGIPEAFLIGADFIGADPVSLILGDNIFFGVGLSTVFQRALRLDRGASIFTYEVVVAALYRNVDDAQNGGVFADQRDVDRKLAVSFDEFLCTVERID